MAIDIDHRAASKIKALVLDVDGVLTNAHLVLSKDGEELKEFSVRDGIGILLAQFAGLTVVFLSARRSEIVTKRAAMLGVTEVYQGEQQKLKSLERIRAKLGVELDEIAYVGDDLVDIAPVKAVGIGIAVGDACEDLKKAARHIAGAAGGRGAVRETVEAILSARGVWQDTVNGFLASI